MNGCKMPSTNNSRREFDSPHLHHSEGMLGFDWVDSEMVATRLEVALKTSKQINANDSIFAVAA